MLKLATSAADRVAEVMILRLFAPATMFLGSMPTRLVNPVGRLVAGTGGAAMSGTEMKHAATAATPRRTEVSNRERRLGEGFL